MRWKVLGTDGFGVLDGVGLVDHAVLLEVRFVTNDDQNDLHAYK